MPRSNFGSSQIRLLKNAVVFGLPCALALIIAATTVAQEIEMRARPEPPRANRTIDPMRPPAEVELETERARRVFEGLDVEKKPHLRLWPGETGFANKHGHTLGNGRAPFLLLPEEGLIQLPEIPHNFPPAERGSPDYIRWVQRSLNLDAPSRQHFLSEDGIFSEETRLTLRDFQKRHSLAIDGIVGHETELALEGVLLPNTAWGRGTHHYQMPPSLLGDKPITDWTTWIIQPHKRVAFLDVKNRNGQVSVSIHGDVYHSVLDSEPSDIRNRPVSSSTELAGFLIGADTIVHTGDPLPKAWDHVIDDKATRLRHSNQSPKRFPGEYVRAAQLLDQHASPETVRVFTALPRETERQSLIRQLNNMGLDRREVDGWQALQGEMQRVQQDSGYTFEPATVAGIRHELTHGKHNTIVLIAHSEDGMTVLPNGERLTNEDFTRLARIVAPDRNLILISCETGTVNGRQASLGEVLLSNKLAANVAAPADPVSAQDVPAMLRDFLVHNKTIGDVFSKLGFITDNESPQSVWKPDSELATLIVTHRGE